MNPRILELKKLATTTRYTGCGEIDELNLEKFAELIIQECVPFVGNENSLAVKSMLQHFEVKR